MTQQSIVCAENEGENLWFQGSLFTFKATSADTDGAFICIEMVAARGKATPMHIHPEEDETFWVLEGEVLLNIDGEETSGGSGTFISVRRGTPHAFVVTSETARVLVLITPGNPATEAFYREAGDPATGRELPPPGAPDIPRIKAAGERAGAVVVVGPPPFELAGSAAG